MTCVGEETEPPISEHRLPRDHELQHRIEAERLVRVDNAASPDFEEGLTAFLDKRAPRFGH